MRRIVCLIVFMAVSTPAPARDSFFTFHGHRIHIQDLRHCRSLSCIRAALPGLGRWRRGRDRGADVDTAPDPASTPAPAVAPAPAPPPVPAQVQPVSPPAPAQIQTAPAPAAAPVQAQPAPAPVPAHSRPLPPVIVQVGPTATRTPTAAVQPASVPAPTLAAVAGAQTARPQIVQSSGRQETTSSTPSAPPPSVGFDVARPQPGTASVKSQPAPDKPAQNLVVQAPPAAAQPAPKAALQVARAPDDSDDDPADTPLGDWQTEGKNGLVRIEACGASLCGYVLNASTREKGETILVNMKPKSDTTWSGNIFSRSSGNSYYGTITMKEPNTLRVEACALGKFFCSGNNWTRLDPDRSMGPHKRATLRPPANRS